MKHVRLYVRDEPEAHYGQVYSEIKYESEFGINGEVLYICDNYSSNITLDSNNIYYIFEYYTEDNEYILKYKIISDKEHTVEINNYSKNQSVYVVREIDCNINTDYITSITIK